MLGPQPLAVLAEGQFPDTFADRAVPSWPDAVADTAATPLEQGPDPAALPPAPAKLLVIGSAKMFDDNIIAASQNALLLLNAVDFLAGNRDLLSIRAKTLTQRVIRPVSAQEKVMWRLVAVLLVPVILAAFGVLRAGARRREATRYRMSVRRADNR